MAAQALFFKIQRRELITGAFRGGDHLVMLLGHPAGMRASQLVSIPELLHELVDGVIGRGGMPGARSGAPYTSSLPCQRALTSSQKSVWQSGMRSGHFAAWSVSPPHDEESTHSGPTVGEERQRRGLE